MLELYPKDRVLKNRFMALCGQHFGIMESQILTSARGRFSPKIKVCTARMPDYQKILIGEDAEINHHLSGSGMYFEEAMIRLLGEGMERYALMLADTFYKDRIFKADYEEACRTCEVMPWEYICMYSKADYRKLEGHTSVRPITVNDEITWIRAQSIFDRNREILIPAQLMFTGFRDLSREIMFAPGFSKGTAAHSTFEKAIKSALLEAVEADAFTISWYTLKEAREIIIDDPGLLEMMSKMMGGLDCEIFPFDYSLPDMPGHSVAVALLGRKGKRPQVIVGCQCDLDAKRAVYKAFLEALAVYYLAVNGALLMPEQYLKKVRDNGYNNLDSNVAYWADTEDGEKKKKFIRSWAGSSILLSQMKSRTCSDTSKDISCILQDLSAISGYGVCLDITPPEIRKKGWYVARCFFPELVQMCLPAFPYSSHPRIKEYGGIKNELPHPVP